MTALALIPLMACSTPEGTCTDPQTFLLDRDQDGYAGTETLTSCTEPDGWSAVRGDCDDRDPDTYPGAPEVWYDGIDQGCDGGTDTDADGDGYAGSEVGGDDCDDTDPDINPGLDEVCGNGVDDDCDGDDGECALDTVVTIDQADAVLDGSADDQLLGWWVELTPDLDWNGRPELLSTSLHYDASDPDDFTYNSTVTWTERDGVQLSSTLWLSDGEPDDTHYGRLFADIDFNGDGHPDLAAQKSDYGMPDRVLEQDSLLVFMSPLPDTATAGSADLRITNTPTESSAFALSIAALGPSAAPTELAIAATNAEVAGSPAAGLVFSTDLHRSGEAVLTDDAIRVYSDITGSGFGEDLVSTDLDGDGVLDLVVSTFRYGYELPQGERSETKAPPSTPSALTVYLGPIDGIRRADDFDGARFADGETHLGFDLLVTPDSDGDGIQDVFAGAPLPSADGSGSGQALLFSGATLTSVGNAQDDLLARIDGSDGEGLGRSLDVGDPNGDGIADLLIAPSQVAVESTVEDGYSTLLFFGPHEGVQTTGDADVAWPVPTTAGDAMWNITTGQDLTADGCDDVAIGVPAISGDDNRGNIYISYGGCQ